MWIVEYDEEDIIQGLQITCNSCQTVMAMFPDEDRAKAVAEQVELIEAVEVVCDCADDPISLEHLDIHFKTLADHAKGNGWSISDATGATFCRRCSSN